MPRKSGERITGLLDRMDAAILAQIVATKAGGGPDGRDWQWIRDQAIPILDELSEFVMFQGPRHSDSDRAFEACARAIAILSFMPHGITLFGLTWEARNGKR